MKLTIDISEEFLSPEEVNDLKGVLGVPDDKEIQDDLQNIIFAALSEYKNMILGNGLPSKADEIQQYRLLQLIKCFYKDRIPNEAEVSMLFHIPESKSRTLIQNTLSRFQHELNETIEKTERRLLGSASKVDIGDDFEVEIQSKFLLDELNRLIQRRATGQQRIYSEIGRAGMFVIPCDTMLSLRRILGINNE